MPQAREIKKSGFIGSSMSFSKSSSRMRMRAQTSLSSNGLTEDDGLESSNTVNVLATQTEASMSSTSFAIPRRSTIDADVSLFNSIYYFYQSFLS